VDAQNTKVERKQTFCNPDQPKYSHKSHGIEYAGTETYQVSLHVQFKQKFPTFKFLKTLKVEFVGPKLNIIRKSQRLSTCFKKISIIDKVQKPHNVQD
jgi:hypothetical protein